MAPPGHVFGFGAYGRVGSFFVLGTRGGWGATLENPFGTLEPLETLGALLCVAFCGNKVRMHELRRTPSKKIEASICTLPVFITLTSHVCVAVPSLP